MKKDRIKEKKNGNYKTRQTFKQGALGVFQEHGQISAQSFQDSYRSWQEPLLDCHDPDQAFPENQQ
jgi:hypothetical protein